MAKKPQTDHAKARAAFIGGWISRDEYILCCKGDAWVSGRAIWLPSWMWWEKRFFYERFHRDRVVTK